MSIGTYELDGFGQIAQEQIDGIISGDVPRSVAEIEAVGRFASEFSAHTPGVSVASEPIAFVRRRGDDLRILNPVEHGYITELGTRDTWRLTEQDRVDFDAIAFHASVDEIPAGYLELFVGVNGDSEATESLRQQALDRLSLASQIDEVEAAEEQARYAKRAADARALIDRRRALRVPVAAELRDQELMQQETQVLPIVSAVRRAVEVRSHRADHRRREGIAQRFGRFLADKFDRLFGVQFA